MLILALSSVFAAAPLHAIAADAASAPVRGAIERAEAKQAQALLARAVSYLQKNGPEKSFAAFNNRRGSFVAGEYYVYALDLDGVMRANGAAPEALVGTNVRDLHDAAGKPFIRELLDLAARSDTGSIEYRWLNRADNRVEHKTASFRKIGKYIVSVGYYLPRSSSEEAQALLDKAVAQIKKSGASAAFKSFNDPQGGFVRGDLYVFAIGLEDGKFRAYGTTPARSGADARDLHDATGKPLVQEMIALAKEKGVGKIDYVWRNPATNAVESKHSVIQRVDDVLLGVGYYSK